MIEMILPDGSVRKLEKSMTVVEFAKNDRFKSGKSYCRCSDRRDTG